MKAACCNQQRYKTLGKLVRGALDMSRECWASVATPILRLAVCQNEKTLQTSAAEIRGRSGCGSSPEPKQSRLTVSA